MGSFKGLTNANIWHEKLKLKGLLSSYLFQEHFPVHYSHVLQALPLPEYMDPISGVLNIAADLGQETSKSDLGPCLYISYGSGENLSQADSVTKLRYNSYDVVSVALLCDFLFPILFLDWHHTRKMHASYTIAF